MNDKPPSTNGTGSTGVWKRLVRAVRGEPLSREEIHELLQQADSVFDVEEKSMLQGVLEVAETQVREVMVPRSQMVVIERSQGLDEMLKVIVDSGHSRFPVIGEDRDEVLGILLAKDLLRYFSNESRGDLRESDTADNGQDEPEKAAGKASAARRSVIISIHRLRRSGGSVAAESEDLQDQRHRDAADDG